MESLEQMILYSVQRSHFIDHYNLLGYLVINMEHHNRLGRWAGFVEGHEPEEIIVKSVCKMLWIPSFRIWHLIWKAIKKEKGFVSKESHTPYPAFKETTLKAMQWTHLQVQEWPLSLHEGSHYNNLQIANRQIFKFKFRIWAIAKN